jgi:predicted MFS family arabinose efflux permease
MPKNLLHVPDTQVGLFLVGNGLMVMLLQLPVAYLLDRRSKVVALAVGAGLFAASSTTLLVTDSFLGILMAFAGFFTLAEMTVEVAGHLWPRRTSPPPRDAAPTSPSSGAASASAMAQAP